MDNERIVFLPSFKLGYTVTGKYPDPTTVCDRHSEQTVSLCVTIQKWYPNLCDLWDLYHIGIRNLPNAMDDDKALEKFNNTIQCKEGCYNVS